MTRGKFGGPRITSNGHMKTTLSWGIRANTQEERDEFMKAFGKHASLQAAVDRIEGKTQLSISDFKHDMKVLNEGYNRFIGDIEIEFENNSIYASPFDTSRGGMGVVLDEICSEFGNTGYNFDDEQQLRKDCPIKFVEFETVARGIWLKRDRPATISPIQFRYTLSDEAILSPQDFEDLRDTIQQAYMDMNGPETQVNFEAFDIIVTINADSETIRNIGNLTTHIKNYMKRNVDKGGLARDYPTVEAV